MRGQPQVVKNDQDCTAAAFQIVQKKQLIANIQMVCRFVEDQGVPALNQGSGDKDKLFFTAGKRKDASVLR